MPIPSSKHLQAFGSLIYQYASAETGLKFCLSGMLDLPPNVVMILTEPYSALNLRNVVKALAKEYEFEGVKAEELIQIIGDFKTHGALRNHIAHSRWTEGKRSDAIKPRTVDIRSERAVWRGSDPDEPDWTATEIEAAAAKLAAISYRTLKFMQAGGLTARIVRHISSTKEESEA